MNIKAEKNTSSRITPFFMWLLKFFINYIWLGVVIILVTVILEIKLQHPSFVTKVSIELLKTIGIAVMVAAIFTFASGTSEFVERITMLLRSIVVTRDFLGDIDSDSKQNALAALIKPSSQQRAIYSNIEDYYNFYIKRTLEVSNKPVRSEYSIICRAFVDKNNHRVGVEETLSYRQHPTAEGYSDLEIRLDADDDLTRCDWMRISTPDGGRPYNEVPNFTKTQVEGRGSKVAIIPFKEHGKDHPHLRVDSRLIEYGENHWIAAHFLILQPTDGFKFFLRCDDELIIKSHYTFVYGAKFHVEKNDENTEILISCDQWLNEGTGLTVVVALPDAHAPDVEKFDTEQQVQPEAKPLGSL